MVRHGAFFGARGPLLLPGRCLTMLRPVPRHRLARLRSGQAVTEFMLTYGVYLLLLSLGVALSLGAYGWMNQVRLDRDVINAVRSIRILYESAVDYSTAGGAMLQRSPMFPPATHVTTPAASATVRLGVNGIPVSAGPGATAYASLGARDATTFVLGFGSATHSLTEDECQRIASLNPPELLGVQILDAASGTGHATAGLRPPALTTVASSATAATNPAGLPDTGGGTWARLPPSTGNILALSRKTPALVSSWCARTSAGSAGAMVLMAFR